MGMLADSVPGLRAQMVRRGITVAELSVAAGVSQPTISRALAGRPVSVPVIARLARAVADHKEHPGITALMGGN